MRKSKKSTGLEVNPVLFFIILFAAVLGIVQMVRAAAGGVQGQPGVTKYDTAAASDSITTTDESYADMPGMSVPFVTTVAAPVVIKMTAATPLQYTRFPGCGYLMRATVDGAPITEEVMMMFPNLGTSGFNFVIPTLPAGTHTAGIQWRQMTSYVGAPGCTQARTLVVEHQ